MEGTNLVTNPDFHVEFLAKQVQRLDEMRKEGSKTIEVTIDQVQMLMLECIGLHTHLKRLEQAVGTAFEFTSLLKKSIEPSVEKKAREKKAADGK